MKNIEPGELMCKYTSKNNSLYELKIDINFKMLDGQYKLIDHKSNIITKNLYRNNQMKKSGYFIVAFLLLLADKYANCHIDVAVDVKAKWSNKFWDYQHLGYAYGKYDSYVYELRDGYSCYKVTYGGTVIWKSHGKERAVKVILSGRGIQKKMVEIDLDDDQVIYFYKASRFSMWKRYIGDNM